MAKVYVNGYFESSCRLALSWRRVHLFLVYRAWRSRIHNGRCKFRIDKNRLELIAHLGGFVIDKDKRYWEAFYVNNRTVKISFDDIRNIEIMTEDIDAMFEESLLEGFDAIGLVFIDAYPKYRDVIKRYSLVVVTKDFKRHPMCVMSQYLVKDFLSWGVDFQLGILELLRLYMPIDLHAQNIYGQFKNFLGREFRFDQE